MSERIVRTVDVAMEAYEQALQEQNVLEQAYSLAREKVLEKVRVELDEVDQELMPGLYRAEQRVAEAKQDALTVAKVEKRTLFGVLHECIFEAGKKVWDVTRLEKFALRHPEVEVCRRDTAAKTYIRTRSTGREVEVGLVNQNQEV